MPLQVLKASATIFLNSFLCLIPLAISEPRTQDTRVCQVPSHPPKSVVRALAASSRERFCLIPVEYGGPALELATLMVRPRPYPLHLRLILAIDQALAKIRKKANGTASRSAGVYLLSLPAVSHFSSGPSSTCSKKHRETHGVEDYVIEDTVDELQKEVDDLIGDVKEAVDLRGVMTNRTNRLRSRR
ncbi:hypothetical protein B0H19DRAFT_1167222 [Mycena capillaripes]|nr:hypothetical protein B0H19DRAFT_1167222 [Mycena capillaripes]